MRIAVDSEWLVPEWPAPDTVRALITTRHGGASRGPYASFNLGAHVGDDNAAVAENRARLRTFLPAEPLWLKQVHGTEVHRHLAGSAQQSVGVAEDRSDMPRILEGSAPPVADAAVTSAHSSVLAIQTADCLPVLLCDRQGSVVAAAHAGWRGLCAGVIENTVRAMQRPGDQLIAYLGPAIGPERFEVGPEVHAAFVAHDAAAAVHFRQTANDKRLADLYGLARQRLASVGVNAVYGGGFCTFNDAERFFSYRREPITGRMAALIWLAAAVG